MSKRKSKLNDCQNPDGDSELYVVEGDSAARTVNGLRSIELQAVLPLQGKPRNALKADLNELLRNPQLADLVSSLGAKWDADGRLDLASIRYQRIILLFDPDADGIHARTLLLFFFYRWMRPLLDAKRIFDTHAPRWAVHAADTQPPEYAFTDEDLVRVRKQLTVDGREETKLKRFLGLGNVDAAALNRYCMAPATRQLLELNTHEAESAMEVFQQLRNFGDQM